MVRRRLPGRRRRTVGAWCFLDDYGPVPLGPSTSMRVPPHPHIGLQTLTYLVAGTVLHHDGLGTVATVESGEVALMTAGSGIAHAEHSVGERGELLHGVQLWIALPDAARHAPPAFDLLDERPVVALDDFSCRVLVGDFADVLAAAPTYSPLVAAELHAEGGRVHCALDPSFEYGVIPLVGQARLDGVRLAHDALGYLATGRATLTIESDGPVRLLLLGGSPFDEPLLMWWNFVARTDDEIAEARHRWATGGFAPVLGVDSAPVAAPELPGGRLRARHEVGPPRFE